MFFGREEWVYWTEIDEDGTNRNYFGEPKYGIKTLGLLSKMHVFGYRIFQNFDVHFRLTESAGMIMDSPRRRILQC